MSTDLNDRDAIAVITLSFINVSMELEHFRKKVEDAAAIGFHPPLDQKQAKIVDKLLYSCSLYNIDQAIRNEDPDTIGPSELCKALEIAVEQLQRLAEKDRMKGDTLT